MNQNFKGRKSIMMNPVSTGLLSNLLKQKIPGSFLKLNEKPKEIEEDSVSNSFSNEDFIKKKDDKKVNFDEKKFGINKGSVLKSLEEDISSKITKNKKKSKFINLDNNNDSQIISKLKDISNTLDNEKEKNIKSTTTLEKSPQNGEFLL